MNIIAGDIGGTKSWLAWASVQADSAGPMTHTVRAEQVYASADFASAEALLQRFRAEFQVPQPAMACLALPGPVHPGKPVQLTNLDWVMEEAALQTFLQADQLVLINDFQAAALGVQTLSAHDYCVLNTASGQPDPHALRVITGPGTGLGLAFMVPDRAGHYRTLATEAGHTDFAPANPQQERLLAFMRQQFSHVSWERVLSGPGVNPVYRFCLQDSTGEIPAHLAGRNGAQVNRAAAEGDAVARTAMQLFADIYANWVGNVALWYQPRGGLYLAGGISARIQPWLQSSRFLETSRDKGRMAGLVNQMPLFLVTNTRLGLQGAMAAAVNHLTDTNKGINHATG